MESFRPEEDEIDRKLLFFLTGRERDDCMMHWLENEHDSLEEDSSVDYEAKGALKTDVEGTEYSDGEY